MDEVKPGRYRHYKGNEYEVIGTARHSENEEEYVVYRALYGSGQMWIRPKGIWLEKVWQDGQELPRFEFMGE